jgi:hypothetical protein
MNVNAIMKVPSKYNNINNGNNLIPPKPKNYM